MTDPVVIVGGGPAGAVAGGILAKHGVPTVLLEKARHPRPHVGESLQPATIDLLQEHLGVGDAIAAAGFAHKFGAVYVWGEEREPWSILFDERLERCVDTITEEELLASDFEKAWQVNRSAFDAILFDAAVAAGVDARSDTEVRRVVFDGDRVRSVVTADGTEIPCSFLVDATGQRCLLGRTLGVVETVDDLRSVAVHAYFRGAGGLPRPLHRHVQFVATVPEGWVWFIPVSADLTSVGLVTRSNRKHTQGEFLEILARAPIPLKGAELVDHEGQGRLLHARDWSYVCRQVVGENFALVGDAACFVDPILSGGVDLAARSAANAALAILQITDGNDPRSVLTEYSDQLMQDFRAYLRMARYWYGNNRGVDGFFWEAHKELGAASPSTPLRAFVYLTSGRYSTDRHLKVFMEWQEKKMFQALGVDRGQLGRALADRRDQ